MERGWWGEAGDRLHRLHGRRQEHRAGRRPRRRAGDDRDRRADGSASWGCRSPRPSSATARRASGPARPRSSARCWRRPTAARSRSAAAASSRERIRAALGRHVVVWLQVDADEAWRRIAHSDRPLATSAADVAAPAGGARCRSTRSWPTRWCRWATARSSAARCRRSARSPICPPGPSCSGPPAPSRRVPGPGRPRPARRRLVAAGGPPLLRHRPRRRRRSTRSGCGPLAATVEVDPGEGAKTMAEAERVLRELARAGMTREDHVVALGGGVVGDLAGFCAHLYQRGVPVVQVPTTLVAQVDSAYGGKTGVDLPEGKNYAGAYQLPAAVLADTAALATLPPDGARRRLRRGAEDRPAGRRRALGAGAGDRGARPRASSTTSSSPAPATSARSSPPTSTTPACATSSTSATPSATRSRRRPATRATATARRSAWDCWRRCASPKRRELRDESRGDPPPPRPAGAPRVPHRRRRHPRRPRARQEADRRRGRLRPPLRARRAPRRAAGRPR